ncbi:hypothetical protein BH09BAC3_BH09BAC3_32970 [soil metagenome]
MWKPFTIEGRTLNSTIEVLHHAAQFVAMVGNSYLPKKPDDSQNNLYWNSQTNHLEGRWLENPMVRISFDVLDFDLIIDEEGNLEIIPLEGWTKDQVLANLIVTLTAAKLDASKLHPISQFTIPKHSLDEGSSFVKPPREILEECTRYWCNAQLMLAGIKSQYPLASEVRVWPHHFDIGLYIPVSRDANGNDIQSIGLGLAIADAYLSEPYFYINHWSKEEIVYPDPLPKMASGRWNTKDWKGLVLPSSAVLSHSNQEKFTNSFFQDGLLTTKQLLNNKATIN